MSDGQDEGISFADLMSGAILGARAEAAAVAESSGATDDVPFDVGGARSGRRDRSNLALLRAARVGILDGSWPMDRFRTAVTRIMRSTAETHAKIIITLAQNKKLTEEETSILTQTRDVLKMLHQGLQMMLNYESSGEQDDLDLGLEVIPGCMATLQSLQEIALAKAERDSR
jgi:hypothetical protein